MGVGYGLHHRLGWVGWNAAVGVWLVWLGCGLGAGAWAQSATDGAIGGWVLSAAGAPVADMISAYDGIRWQARG